jgi:hypothetical protein
MERRENFVRNMYGGGRGGMAAPLPHACIWHSSFICWWHWNPSMWLFISLICSPSSWATEDDLPYTISFFYFAGTRNTSSNQFLSSNDLGISLGRGILTFTNLYLLMSSPLSLLHILDTKEIPTRRNFGFLVIFSRNHSPKILLTPLFFLTFNLLRASF